MPASNSESPILEVNDLIVEFDTEYGPVRAVDRVSFSLNAGDTLGIVGESGCGKTVTCLSLLGLVPSPPGRILSGSIVINGTDVVGLSNRQLRNIRGRDIAMIFQEPMTALNPVFTVGQQIKDVIRRHTDLSRRQTQARALDMLKLVEIPAADKRINDYPHQLSGGMRQRVMIAMALACSPKVLVADEPTTALDVTTQAQVLEQIVKLQRQLDMAMILITHDMGVVAQSCQRVMVMYCGQVIETAKTEQLFAEPAHPYTKGLLAAIPRIRKHRLDKLPVIAGMVPDLRALPLGCRFSNRCDSADHQCLEAVPRLSPLTADGSQVACFHPQKVL